MELEIPVQLECDPDLASASTRAELEHLKQADPREFDVMEVAVQSVAEINDIEPGSGANDG